MNMGVTGTERKRDKHGKEEHGGERAETQREADSEQECPQVSLVCKL